MIKLHFSDGSSKEFPKGVTGEQIVAEHFKNHQQSILAADLNGQVIDLITPINESGNIKFLKFSDAQGAHTLRHTSSHVLALAVKRLFPGVKITIGPAIEDGFYYDFDNLTIKEEDFSKVEEEMNKILHEKLQLSRRVVSREEALELFKDEPYKVELINDLPECETITTYTLGEFEDLCRGPHVPNTKFIGAIKLLKIAGAYWRGDNKRKMLTRVYGTAFPEKKMLTQYLLMMQEAEKRNHKKIGEEMEIFAHFDMLGKGLPVWLPKGEIIKQEIERFALETEERAGFQRVSTPHLAKKELFLTSGHLPYYAQGMYPPMEMDDGTYYLKAMNCPMHHLIFARKPRSYREMPVRLAEYGTVYRNELSGTLTGLLRVRCLRMNDAHIYCTKDQIEQEVEACLTMIKDYFATFNFKDYWFRLSLSDPGNKEKYIDEPENWEYSEGILRNVLQRLGLQFVEIRDEAAFYGPKIDVQFKNVYGREETMSTVQLDFAAKKRFGLFYVDNQSQRNTEVFVIHRAPLSTHERFIAFLIEHFAGKFPLWLSPVQAKLLPLTDRNMDYTREVASQMRKAGIRVEIDERSESAGKKVRDAQIEKVNYILVIGDKEQSEGSVNVRTRAGEVKGTVSIEQLISNLVEEIKNKSL